MLDFVEDDRFPILDSAERLERAQAIANTVVRVSQLVDDFAGLDRAPRLANGNRESDVEHSFMLAILAPELAPLYDVNPDAARAFSVAHDFPELTSGGDVATFNLTAKQLAEKDRREKDGLPALFQRLPQGLAHALKSYEQQDTADKRFVRLTDKLLPLAVDITGEGVRVLIEDFKVDTLEKLQASHQALHARIAEKYGRDFPDIVAAHAVLCQMFEVKFKAAIESQKVEERSRSEVETELKFLIDISNLPPEVDLGNYKREHLTQGYIAIGNDGSETRVRSYDDERFELTVKSPGMIGRGEQSIKISKEMFYGLLLQANDRLVAKTRYYIPYGDLTIELDVYEGRLEGLVTAEIEFDGRPADAMIQAATFEPPAWFGRNVSEDVNYKNHSLAVSMPHPPMVLDEVNP